MKKFFSTIIAWIKAHVWKSVIIGVASCAVIATAITLPIVLSNKEEPASEEPSNPEPDPQPEPGPGPTPTPVTKYAVSVQEATGGTIDLSETGEFEAGKEILITVTPDACYKFVEITINGEAKSTSNPYLFTVSKDLADDQNKIVVSAKFEEDSPTSTSITIDGPSEVVVNKTITLTAVPDPEGSIVVNDIQWSIIEGTEYVEFVSPTKGESVVIKGIYGDQYSTIKAMYGDNIEATVYIYIAEE